MKITRVKGHYLADFPITPPPFREQPDKGVLLIVGIDTDEGITGWGAAKYAHPSIIHVINTYMEDELLGMDPLRREYIRQKINDPRPDAKFVPRHMGRMLTGALSAIDIALWDILGQHAGQPLHVLLGGASDQVPVYLTHGAAYNNASTYTHEELGAEAKALADQGNTLLKNTVGRQIKDGRIAPDPEDDYRRMKAMRDAVGSEVKLAMDGNCRMSVPQAQRLAELCADLDISFFEEPVVANNPTELALLRQKSPIAIAAAENHLYSASDLIRNNAVDILQPNVVNDGGYTGALENALTARAHQIPIGHGNGGGPHNIALQAGLGNGTAVEYHYHVWQEYDAVFENVPEPINGYVTAPNIPGTGLHPKDGILEEFTKQP